jgi:hypothetical protein
MEYVRLGPAINQDEGDDRDEEEYKDEDKDKI